MQLIEPKYKIRCEMGVCKNFAAKTIKMDRTGIKSAIHICDACLTELYGLIGETLIPKSFETAKPTREKAAKAKQGGEKSA